MANQTDPAETAFGWGFAVTYIILFPYGLLFGPETSVAALVMTPGIFGIVIGSIAWLVVKAVRGSRR